MITIQPLTDRNNAAVHALTVDSAQHAFVSPIEDMLAARAEKPLEIPYAIQDDDLVVGFCFLNFDPAATAHYCDDATTCGLEGFLIDRRYQGQGYGIRAVAALRDFIRANFPTYTRLNLTVNSRNVAAKRMYEKAGFVDTGRLYYGGRSGPQHIYSLPLSDTC